MEQCTECRYEIVETLMEFPFNVSQKGFPMIISCIEKQIENKNAIRHLSKSIINEVAEEYNVTSGFLEKAMRDTIATAGINCLNNPDIVYPNYLIKTAFRETRVKSFISAMSLYILIKRSRRELEMASKNVDKEN